MMLNLDCIFREGVSGTIIYEVMIRGGMVMSYGNVNLGEMKQNDMCVIKEFEKFKIEEISEKSHCKDEDTMYAVIYLCLYKVAMSDEPHVCIEGIMTENRNIAGINDFKSLVGYLVNVRRGSLCRDRYFEYGIFNSASGKQTNAHNCETKISFKTSGDKIYIIYEGKSISELEIESVNNIINNIVNTLYYDSERNIADIRPLNEEEENRYRQLYIKSERKYSEEKTIIDLFEEQVECTPDNIAVSDMSTELSYGEFNKKINRIANFLIDKGVKTEDVIAHLIPSDVRCLIVLMGILKAGGTQLPMVNSMPKDRINYMINDSNAKYVITTHEYEEKINDKNRLVFVEDMLEYEKTENPHINITLNNIYVCLYTSGTTGRPKGVINTHRGLVYGVKYGIVPGVKSYGNSILSTPLCFIMANLEIYSPLVRGNKVLVVNPEIRKDIPAFRKLLCENDTEILTCTPSYFDAMTQNEDDARLLCDNLKFIVLGGEKVYVNKNVEQIYKDCNAKILDGYGSTEVHLAALREITEEYGWAFHNVKLIIVSREGYMLPPGIKGEIYIAGDGVGAGYINDKKLSEEKFSDHLFGFRRVYKTGDIGILNEAGELKILGRNDYQIKIRGYRIELKEVEKVMDECPSVEKGIVIAKTNPNNEKYLCAFYIGTCDRKGVKEFMERKLPSYMIPSYIMQMEELPKLISGKYDLKKLSEIEIEKADTLYIAPQTEMQKKLAGIWENILCIKNIGIDDNFFEIGGDSIKAAKLIAAIRDGIQMELSLKQLFGNPTIRGIEGELNIFDEERIVWEKAQEKDYYAMTSSQIGIYLSCQKDSTKTNYNLTYCIELDGKINIDKLKESVTQVVSRHEALRTSFHIIDGRFVQKVHNSAMIDFNIMKMEEFDKSVLDNFAHPFQLDRLPLMRVRVVEDKKHTIIMLDVHHIIADGYSMQMMMQEICDFYNGKELSKPVYQFRDYSERLNGEAYRNKVEADKKYWIDTLNQAEVLKLNLIPDYQNSGTLIGRGKRYNNKISGALYKAIKKFCGEHELTEHMLFLGCLSFLLSRYANQSEFAIGTPILGRDDVETQHIMGMFVRTLPIVMHIDEEISVSEYFEEVKRRCIQAFDNQICPMEDIKSQITHGKGHSLDSVFNVMFVLQNNQKALVNFEGQKITEVSTPDECDAMYDMLIEMDETEEGIDVCWQYLPDLFNQGTIDDMFRHLEDIICTVIDKYHIRLADIDICTNIDKKIIEGFNETNYKYDRYRTVVDFFNAQAAMNADKVAVEAKDGNLSYDELYKKANKIANFLIAKEIQTVRIIPFMLSRNSNMVAVMLGILKAGCAYLPIDSSYPQNRINFILEDCGAQFLITDKMNFTKAGEGTEVILVEDLIACEDFSDPNIEVSANDLCYCIYTSGSTGKPKGTLLEHRTLCNLVTWEKETQEIKLSGRVLAGTTISFDVATQEIMSTLLCGGTLVLLADGDKTNINSYCNTICDKKVDVLFCTPSYLDLIAEQDIWIEKICEQVSDIVLAGEAIYLRENIRKLAKTNFLRIHNHYGPTESHVVTAKTYYGDYNLDVSIGKPINNTKIYVTDKIGRMVPAGIPGELCITGESVGRGYWNRGQLTSEKFVENPFGSGRMYKTGDLARWTENGELHYLGRMDEQLKIRGLRIEPGEIRNVLCKQQGVKDAVVVLTQNETGDKYLCAYITGDGVLDLEEVRKSIRMELAEYMVPDYMMQIDKVPINANGKLDKTALPAFQYSENSDFVEPAGVMEKMICRCFSEVLGLERVGANDNFFRIGGHSLKAMLVANRIEQETGIRLELNTLFANPSPRELAEKIQCEKKRDFRSIPKAEKSNIYPMSSAQKRMFILNQINKEEITYNLPYFFRVEGRLNIHRLKYAVDEAVKRHSILRTTFHMENGMPVQKIHDEMQIEVESNISAKQFIRPFDLEAGPLLRVCYTEELDTGCLMFDMHHIISDGITLKNLITEIIQLYMGSQTREEVKQYSDYSEWMRNFRIADIEMQKQYWIDKFAGGIPVLDIITDFPRPSYQSHRGKSVVGKIPPTLSQKIQKLAADSGATPYMVLLGGAMILLSRYARQEEIIIGTPISGRVHRDTENMLGMFVNTLVLKGDVKGEKTCQDFLQEIKEECLGSFHHQEYPFEELVESLSVVRGTSRNPLFDVMFNMQEKQCMDFNIDDVKITGMELSHLYNISKFDMTINIKDEGDQYGIVWEYCTDLFEEKTIAQMMNIYIDVLNRIATGGNIRIADVSLCNQNAAEQILTIFNANQIVPLPFENIGEAFEAAVIKNADKTAICFKDFKLSYRELRNQVNAFVKKLLVHGLKHGDRVVVCMERGIKVVVMQLAVIKAGGVFVPVDNEYPDKRILYTIRDSQAKFVMFDAESVLDIDCGCKVLIYEEELDNAYIEIDTRTALDDECYVIYTSGSTGEPKGCRLTHKGILNFCLNNNVLETAGKISNPTGVAVNSVAFDYFIAESLFMLLNGFTVVLADRQEQTEQKAFKNLVIRNHVNIVQTTPTRLGLFMEDTSDTDYFTRFKMIVLSGEELKKSLFAELRDITSAKIYNPCGPSEASVWAAGGDIADCEEDVDREIHIGKPIFNVQIYIMDQYNNLLPVNVPGELVIGGAGVGLGYINKEDLTKEKFVDNPYGSGKLYKTGDLAAWRPDGNIKYLGRLDQQIKIRGLRIEIGEIESVLKKQPDIKNAVVIVKNVNEDKRLCAYLVSDSVIDSALIRRQLETELPDYMIPTYMIQTDKIYYNANGKLDKSKFPEIVIKKEKHVEVSVSAKEALLLHMVEKVLGIDNIDMEDDFFELGGDSIKAIRIVTKFREAGYEITVREILSKHVIGGIIGAANDTNAASIYSQEQFTGIVPLSPIIQEYGTWGLKYPDYFNQANMLRIKSTLYDDEAIIYTLNMLCRQHDMLRSVFGNGCLEVLPYEENKHFDIYYFDIDNISEDDRNQYVNEQCTKIQSTMNLKEGPLVKIGVFKELQYTHILICVHHLVIDGVSWRVLLDDFDLIYEKKLSGEEYKGLLKTAQYKEWVQALNNFGQSQDIQSQTDYWNEVVNHICKIEPNQDCCFEESDIDTISVFLNKSKTKNLLSDTQRVYNTEIHELLLAALVGAASKITGMKRISVSMEGHGREELGVPLKIDRTIGWFTNIYPLTLQVLEENISKLIVSVKESVRRVPMKGIGYGILKYMSKSLIVHERPTIGFNYLGDFDAERIGHNIVERSEYTCGTSISEHNRLSNDISINCFISEEKLHILVSYDTKFFNRDFILDLANTYLEYLENIMIHCSNTTETIYSSSDFGDLALDSDEMDEILQLFD